MPDARSIVAFAVLALLVPAGWADHRHRRVPAVLLVALMVVSAPAFLAHFERMDLGLATGMAAVASLWLGVVLGVIGLADAVVASAVLFLLGSADPDSRSEILTTQGLGTMVALVAWAGARARRSWIISGPPSNVWDVLALGIGRLEPEPWLVARNSGASEARSMASALAHLEAARTPDGFHLYLDPCPFVACIAAAYPLTLLVWSW